MNNEINEIKEMAERNYELISKNTKKINANLERINANSYALDILGDYKKDSERLFAVSKKLYNLLVIVLGLWFVTIGCLIFVLSK